MRLFFWDLKVALVFSPDLTGWHSFKQQKTLTFI